MDFHRALQIVTAGYDAWASKPHNNRWYRRIDGTPVPNDLRVCIAEAVFEALSAPTAKAEEGSEQAALERDATRYRYLRSRDAGPDGELPPAGLFIGQVPENLILTDADADAAIDAQMARDDR